MRRLAVPAALFSFTAVLVPAAFFAAYGSNGGILESLRQLATPTNVISRADYFLTQLRVQVTYLRLLFFPKGQNLDYDYPVFHSLFSLPVAASLILILALIFCAFCLLAQARKKGPPDLLLAGFGILWFFVTLSVESTLIPLQDVIFEHRIYLPSVGFFAAFVTILFAAKRHMSDRKIAAAGIVIPFLAMIVLLSAAAAAARNEVWRDEVTLWQDVVVNSPAKARAHGSLGSAYQKRGRYDEAALEYETAIKLDQKDAASYNNLGTVYQLGQKWEDAASMYRKAVVLDPKNVKARYNLGTVLTKLGRYNEAEAELREAVRLKPDYDAAHNALGIVYARLTRNGDALAEFGKAARLNPGNSEAVSNFQALNNAMNGEPRLNK
jgi:Flp pilus assembly protein TadD